MTGMLSQCDALIDLFELMLQIRRSFSMAIQRMTSKLLAIYKTALLEHLTKIYNSRIIILSLN